MIFAFFESVKYVGHMLPVVVLRIYLGWWFLAAGMAKNESDYLFQPKLAAAITENMPLVNAPDWYRQILDGVIVPHWQIFAYSLMYFEFLIGMLLLIGFLARPMALLAAIVAWGYLFMTGPEQWPLYRMVITMSLVLAWVGAGRCLGLDYFFYKRHRGLLW